MDKSEFLTMLGEWQGITLDQARAERMARSGGVYEMLSGMRTILFRMDVSEYLPLDAPVFGPAGGAK
ncbi:MAG: hypothetical protein JRD68_02835 [Deltaproteobacteria bacterium]|nr:hypothetical protein [Deltaproteobacteria bacterium]